MDRICNECKKVIVRDGFVVSGGDIYYCSEGCLHIHYTKQEWEEMYTDDGDNYWTEWHTVELETPTDEIEIDIEELEEILEFMNWGDIEEFCQHYTEEQAILIKHILESRS